MPSLRAVALAAGLLLAPARAQWPDCNPLWSKDCPMKKLWPISDYYVDFTQLNGQPPRNWTIADGTPPKFTSQGAEFTWTRQGDAPQMWTSFYVFTGRYDIVLKAAPGIGVVTNSVLWSDVQDEIDWEWSGNSNGNWTGGVPVNKPFPPPDGLWRVQTNLFKQMHQAGYTDEKVYKPTELFHKYSVIWDRDYVQWLVDDVVFRTVNRTDAAIGGLFPETPMKLQVGVWDGGDPTNPPGVIDWAGGLTDLNGGPYTAIVKSIRIKSFRPMCKVFYNDQSGSFDSVIRQWGSAGECYRMEGGRIVGFYTKRDALPEPSPFPAVGGGGNNGLPSSGPGPDLSFHGTPGLVAASSLPKRDTVPTTAPAPAAAGSPDLNLHGTRAPGSPTVAAKVPIPLVRRHAGNAPYPAEIPHGVPPPRATATSFRRREVGLSKEEEEDAAAAAAAAERRHVVPAVTTTTTETYYVTQTSAATVTATATAGGPETKTTWDEGGHVTVRVVHTAYVQVGAEVKVTTTVWAGGERLMAREVAAAAEEGDAEGDGIESRFAPRGRRAWSV